jgi:hypothetical protein
MFRIYLAIFRQVYTSWKCCTALDRKSMYINAVAYRISDWNVFENKNLPSALFSSYGIHVYVMYNVEGSLCRLIRRSEHLIGRLISRQTEGQSFGDHISSESVSVATSSVIEPSIVLSSVSYWLVWVNAQSACALNTRYVSEWYIDGAGCSNVIL